MEPTNIIKQLINKIVFLLIISLLIIPLLADLTNDPCIFGKAQCKNKADCINNMNNTFSCQCVNGFYGEFCEYNYDDCINNECAAGSTCVDGIAKYTCECPPGKIGFFCNLDDICARNPCGEGSYCDINTGTGQYECLCRKGFTGTNCSEDIDECNLNIATCYNGGTCINTFGSWKCKCPVDYLEPLCITKMDLCADNPCHHRGSCMQYAHNLECICHTGFHGEHCKNKCRFDSIIPECTSFISFIEQNDERSSIELKLCEIRKCKIKSGNKICDEDCNTVECGFDGGDCSAGMKPFENCEFPGYCSRVFQNNKCDPICNNEKCLYDGFDCKRFPKTCPIEGCGLVYRNNYCDVQCNISSCMYDGGDCYNPSPNIKLTGKIALVILIEPEKFVEKLSYLLAILREKTNIHFDTRVKDKARLIHYCDEEICIGSLYDKVGRTSERYCKDNCVRGTEAYFNFETQICSSNEITDICFENVGNIAAYLGALASKKEFDKIDLPLYKIMITKGREEEYSLSKIIICISMINLCVLCILAFWYLYRKKQLCFREATSNPLLQRVTWSSNDYHAPITLLPKPERRWTYLHTAAAQPNAIHFPIKGSINTQDRLGYTPLMITAMNLSKAESSSLVDMKAFLNAGADIDAVNDDGETALLLAIKVARCSVVKFLLDNNADPSIPDNNATTPLHHAAAICADEIVQQLTATGRVDVNAVSNFGWTPLILCSKYDYVDAKVAENLLSCGASLEASDVIIGANYDCRTPLHYAAQHCNINIVRFLIQAGSNVNAEDIYGRTPLDMAESEGHDEVIQILLDHGATYLRNVFRHGFGNPRKKKNKKDEVCNEKNCTISNSKHQITIDETGTNNHSTTPSSIDEASTSTYSSITPPTSTNEASTNGDSTAPLTSMDANLL